MKPLCNLHSNLPALSLSISFGLSAARQGQVCVPQSEQEGARCEGEGGSRSGKPGRLHRQAEEAPGGERAGSAGGGEGESRGCPKNEAWLVSRIPLSVLCVVSAEKLKQYKLLYCFLWCAATSSRCMYTQCHLILALTFLCGQSWPEHPTVSRDQESITTFLPIFMALNKLKLDKSEKLTLAWWHPRGIVVNTVVD